ncbi:primosomal protein N' [Paenibacillus antri]|uniref:Replication restart protein PriA n=1 Tax=Paenibacillus antri TaxID=2582848 RepID=A0A5R9G276_9BACL|nr:primosomal protein N' [Paenibacillus antri]TLS49921.1 primosomal protein N' [Paenibacillus antri]
MIAKVIVDAPARDTDRPFDYAVPDKLAPLVRPGVRAAVPFGPRTLNGFVLAVEETSDMDPSRLKPLKSVLDAAPVVTEELLDLAGWLSRKYLCPQYTALTALLPSALKTKTETVFEAAVPPSSPDVPESLRELLAYVDRRGRVPEKSLLQAFADRAELLTSAILLGLLTESKEVKDRLGMKVQLCVRPSASAEALTAAADAARRRAPKQAELLDRLASLADEGGEPPLLAELARDSGIGPAAVKALESKGFCVVEAKELSRDPYADRRFEASRPLPLTETQAAALSPIRRAIEAKTYAPFLLHGVTGSGKTEVYLQAMQACLEAGREAILLVPEISLTPQTVNAFKGRFGDEVAVMHSRLSAGERYDEWRKIARRRVKIAIGARSAIFAPFTNVGLIIIDEEHESSYKQEESPKYHARDVALERASRHGAAVVLGSATPALETYLAAHRGVYTLLEMPDRAFGQAMPRVDIVDMRQELRDGNRSMFSARLREALATRLERGEQSVLLLNRRGYSTFVMCRSCGFTAQCPHCDITLTYHRSGRHSRCHYCGYTEREATRCPSCESEHIRHFGAGTQRVEEELAKLFPGIRTIRMDVDTTSTKGAHEKLLADFRERKADVLLGTQMVAKGLDFPFVTLVGVISADTVLRLPDFRAAERTFQLLTQVAGRAGRHQLPGEVVVQTYTPEHYSIQFAQHHDFRGFARRELISRRELGYPPYCRLALATLAHEDISRLVTSSERFAGELKKRFAELRGAGEEPELLGPVPSPIPKLKDRYRFQCMVKYRGETNVADALRASADALSDDVRKSKLSIQLDVDPQVLL